MATDFNRLRLRYHDDSEMLDRILQEECRVKCAKKLPATLSNLRFRFPSLALAEMCTSDAVAAIHAGMVSPGDKVLDMTAGLGVDTFAFASSGCHVTAVELDAMAVDCLRENVDTLNLNDRVTVVNADSLEWLSESLEQFDVIFVDPARRDTGGRHISLRNCMPDITGRMADLLARAGKVVVKTSPMIDISAAVKEFGRQPSHVTVIGTTRECKEVVFTFARENVGERMLVECATVGHGVYKYQKSEPFYADPTEGNVLMQPYPAVMK
ncbi:MAG: class I SAM-dependent methyltransferase, partial [Duncaniella sp.]|nr:class I SAM-dependent methyltransferase [Duncaniella sp.]